MNVFMVRVGQTIANARDRTLSNRQANNLTDLGRFQSRCVAQRNDFVALEFECVYCSGSVSGVETAGILVGLPISSPLQGPHEDVIIRQEFREMDWGAWEGTTEAERKEKFPKEWRAFLEGDSLAIPSASESLQEVAGRMLEGLRRLYDEARDGNTCLVVHGGSSRVLIASLMGRPLTDLPKLPGGNASVTVFVYTGGEKAHFLYIGDESHIPQELRTKPAVHVRPRIEANT